MRKPELVVFLHAVGGDSTFWRPQVEALKSAYETFAIDFVCPAEQVSMAAFADDVARAIERAGYARAHLVGLSMGGVVALETFRRHPSRVRSITMANSWAFMPDGEGRVAWVTGMLADRSVAEFSNLTLPDLFAPTTDRALVAASVAIEGRKDKAMYLACWRSMLLADQRDILPKLDVPLLLIGGELDRITTTDPLLTSIHAVVPTARLVNISGAAHFSNLDRPDEFSRALLAFLRDARSPAPDLVEPDAPSDHTLPEGTTAEQLLRLLALRGVELFASNSGTDFTPLIDALAKLEEETGHAPLRVVAAPHENTAIGVAHGHALLSGKPQAVMAHVNVGTANMGLGLINARRARVPMLVLAGKTPWYEQGKPGVRTNFVQWGQDTFDQAGSFREFTKWDYELKGPHALDTVIDRALSIAASSPAGPVYLTLPKEPLCEVAPSRLVAVAPRQTATRPMLPDEISLEAAEKRIRAARRPLLVTADLGRHPGGPEALVRFSRAARAGVVEHGKRNFFNFPTAHPHHLGFDPHTLVPEADLVIVVEAPGPWIPAFTKLERAPQVIAIGPDPLFADLPMRGFPTDLSLSGDPVEILRALSRRLAPEALPPIDADLLKTHEQLFHGALTAARADASRERITKSYLSLCIGEAVDDDVVIFNEYDLDPWLVPRRTAASWFENSVASGLGWSLGAALGAAIAAPERTALVTVGDGAYLFNTPLSAHHLAASEGLPLCVIIFDDSAWSTIKRSTKGSHPTGASVRTGRFPLCDFAISPRYDEIARAFGGEGLRITKPEEVPGALKEALSIARQGRQVLVDVVCERDG